MRQVACSGSLPPRWVTKNFSACGVITARRASRSPRLTRAKGTSARRRRPLPLRLRLRLASPCSRARAHTRALAPPAFATAKQPST